MVKLPAPRRKIYDYSLSNVLFVRENILHYAADKNISWNRLQDGLIYVADTN